LKAVKIVATIGPSSIDKIERLIREGVDVFRLNFSHADHKTHKASISTIRAAAKKLGTKTAILQDISGPKIRIGDIEGILELKKGDIIYLVKSRPKSPYELTLSYPQIIDDLRPGEYIFFADGSIRAKVLQITNGRAKLLVKNAGVLSSRKGVNFPHSNLSLSAITPKDEKDLIFGAKNGVDIVAISFLTYSPRINAGIAALSRNACNCRSYFPYAKSRCPDSTDINSGIDVPIMQSITVWTLPLSCF